MVTLRQILPAGSSFEDDLVLPFDRRQHSRLRAALASGREVALLLPRGTVLRDGDRLGGTDRDGAPIIVRVVAAVEELFRITGERLIRAAYHLGNRHVPVHIGRDFLRIERDSVLRELLERLGFDVVEELAPFEPEPGAYAPHTHSRGS